MDLTLPRIEPASPVRSAANEIDQAGAKFKQAADSVANVMSEDAKAQIAVQTQEAMLQSTRGLDTALHVVRSNPYIDPNDYLGTGKTLEEVLGGTPKGMDLTEQVPGQPDPTVRQRKKLVKMHDIAPELFDHMAGAVSLAAAQNINEAPWRRNFERAAAKDVEAKRAEMLDWQRGQRLADAEITTEAQLKQAAAARNWAGYRAILDTPENQLGVAKREAFRENLPLLQTQGAVEDRLRSRDIADIEKLRSDIMGNVVSPDTGLVTKLSADQQYHFSKLADERIREIQHEEEWQRKRAEEKRFEQFGDTVQQAVTISNRTSRPLSSLVSVNDIPIEMGFHNFVTYKNFLDQMAKPPRTENDPRAWMELSSKDKTGALGSMSRAEMMMYWPYLTEGGRQTWMDRWAGAGKGEKPLFSDNERKLMERALVNVHGFDPKKNADSADRFDSAMAMLEQNMLTWRKKNPDVPMTYDIIRTESKSSTFNELPGGWFGPKNASAWVKKNLGDMDSFNVLSVGVRSATPGRAVTSQDLLDHVNQMEKEAPEVDAAWAKLNPAAPLDGAARATIHSVLINPVERERVDAQLLDQKLEVNDKNRVWRVVQNMQIPQSVAKAAENEAKAQQEAAAAQVRASGEAQRVEAKAQTAAEKAAAEADRIAKRDAFYALPYWEQRATIVERDTLRESDDQTVQQILGRLKAEDRAAQQLRAGPGKSIMGDRYSDDPVQIEMVKRAKAEAAISEQTRHAALQEQFAMGKARYRALMNDYQRGDPEAVKLVNSGQGYSSFDSWFEAWKQGKVR